MTLKQVTQIRKMANDCRLNNKQPQLEIIKKCITKEDRIGALKDIPIEIICRMVYEAALQGNSPEIAIEAFQNDRMQWKERGGFNWPETSDGVMFWHEVLYNRHWMTFLKKYPIEVKVKSKRAKMTTARNLSKGQIIRTINLLSHILKNKDIQLVESERDFMNHAITCLSTIVYDINVSNEENLWDWRTKYLSGAIKLAEQDKLKSDQDEDNKKD